jgi:hypothetical protein
MSEVKVNKISPRTNCGTVTVGDSGDSVSVSAGVPVTVNGDLKSNALKATDGGSIISQCGTTITLGASGDTINLASGASQTGFGRTGTVDWDTTAKTAGFTAVSGNGYFVNTTSSAITVTLPAGSAGDIVSLADYAATWQTNNLTVSPNGSDKIGNVNADVVLNTEGQSVTFVFVDSTQGWINIQDSTSNVRGNAFIEATGGTITTSGNCKIHTFTGPGTFTVTNIAACAAQNIMSHLVVAGGGGGGSAPTGNGGGGGAGGLREVKNPATPYTASPLDGYPSAPNRVTITATSFPITVGAGGSAASSGSTSTFSTITSAGGGRGGNADNNAGLAGGSGGGGGSSSQPVTPGQGFGGAGNTPPVSPSQGNPGGTGGNAYGGSAGGGGASAAGSNGNPSPPQGGNNNGGAGGNGVTTNITASPVAYAGGGGGGGRDAYSTPSNGGGGGTGGGGNGGNSNVETATPGTTNRGGGGGGAGENATNRAGGSGIVIIRYKFQ